MSCLLLQTFHQNEIVVSIYQMSLNSHCSSTGGRWTPLWGECQLSAGYHCKFMISKLLLPFFILLNVIRQWNDRIETTDLYDYLDFGINFHPLRRMKLIFIYIRNKWIFEILDKLNVLQVKYRVAIWRLWGDWKTS